MKALAPILRLIGIVLIDFKTYRLHPLSDYTAHAVIRRNELERPIYRSVRAALGD